MTTYFKSTSAGYSRKGAPHTHTDTSRPCSSSIAAPGGVDRANIPFSGVLGAGDAWDHVIDVADGAGREEGLDEAAIGTHGRYITFNTAEYGRERIYWR